MLAKQLGPLSRTSYTQNGIRSQAHRLKRRRYATVTDLASYPSPGEQLHGFTVQKAQHVPELELTALHLQHDKTGADYLHIARDDKNNVFSIGFKTNPPDDTGVPHILEHTTLCGSEKFPVRDPFFKMLPRSLSNYMNAFTSSDHTTYPFATTNAQDFKNLLSVYLDATLHPLLNENDFTQEGWRIGPENPEALAEGTKVKAEDKKLVFKGVVYNEMKGQVSDASYLYYIKFQDHIFPAINNSGGDPQKMTDLTYQDLKGFHERNYHPSNARIYTYGNMPLSDHLTQIGNALSGFQKVKADQDIKVPITIDGPKEFTLEGPVDSLVDQDKQIKTSISWVFGDMADVHETFALEIIANYLLTGYGSPLYRALIESGLGLDWSPNTGYDTSGKVGIFSVGLNGVKEENLSRIKDTIHSTIQEVRQKGFDSHKIEGQLHQLQLSLKHKTANFGMGIMHRLTGGWFNGVNPFDALEFNKIVGELRSRMSKGSYFEGLLERHLLNDRTLTFTMKPSAVYGDTIALEEAARLSAGIADAVKQAGGEDEAIKQLTAREMELLQAQAQKQDLNCLPMVRVADIPRQMEKKSIIDSLLGNVKVQWRQASTNGLTYFRAIHLLSGLPEELRILMPLFNDAIKRIGTKQRSMEELEDLMKLKTGGITSNYHSTVSPINLDTVSEGFSFSGFALDTNVPTMYELLRTLLYETDFSSPKAEAMILELLQSDAAGALDSVASSGHAYARRYAEAQISDYAVLSEQVGGLTHVRHMASLAAQASKGGLGEVIEKLKAIQKFVLSNDSQLRVALTCGPEAVKDNESALQHFLQSLPSRVDMPQGYAVEAVSRNSKTFFPLPYQVYYSARAFQTVPYIHQHSAPLQVLAQLLTHKHLHHEIREKGGAYGGGAYAKSLSGVIGLYSYRDPNPQNTLRVMQNAGEYAVRREWTEQELEEAKLSVFQGVDAPESVNQEGMTRFTAGVDEDMEQKKREQLLDVSIKDVQEVAQAYIVDGAAKAALAVLGEKKDWVKEEDGWRLQQVTV